MDSEVYCVWKEYDDAGVTLMGVYANFVDAKARMDQVALENPHADQVYITTEEVE